MEENKRAITKDRIRSVDFLKGLAVLWILAYHVYYHMLGFSDISIELWGFSPHILSNYVSNFRFSIEGILRTLCGLGYQGIPIFVMMSGFLQTWRHHHKDWSQKSKLIGFFKRKVSRIYPMYWLAIIIVIAFHLLQARPGGASIYNIEVWPVSLKQIFVDFLGLQVIKPEGFFSINPSFWFIGLIIQLYLIFPLASKLYKKMSGRLFLLLSLFVSVASLFYSMRISTIHPYFEAFFGAWLFLFSLGMVLANNYEKVTNLFGKWTILPFFTLYVSGLYLSGYELTWPLGRLMYGTGITLFIWSIFNTIKSVSLLRIPQKIFESIGRVSYQVYLLNEPFVQAFFVFAITGGTFSSLSTWENPLSFRSWIGHTTNLQVISDWKFLALFIIYAFLIILISYGLAKADKSMKKSLSSLKNKILD